MPDGQKKTHEISDLIGRLKAVREALEAKTKDNQIEQSLQQRFARTALGKSFRASEDRQRLDRNVA